jgi:hypothetical protein
VTPFLLPRLVARLLRAPMLGATALALVLFAAGLAVVSPGPASEHGNEPSGAFYELAFLDGVLLGATSLALTSAFGGLFARASPANRLALEGGLLVAATAIPLAVVLPIQSHFLPPGADASSILAHVWPQVLAVAAVGLLLLRFSLAPSVRALTLVAAVWVLPALVLEDPANRPAVLSVRDGALAPLSLAPILGCVLAAWLCLTRRTAHR